MRSISERLKRLEGRPQNQIPQFIIEHADGRRDHWRGMDILSYLAQHDDIRHITFDGMHQASIDGVALIQAIYGDKIKIIAR